MSGFRRTSSRIAYENPWLRVREDEFVRPDGSPGLYGVVEKADFALVIPLEEGAVHLVEQYRYPVGERQWEFPQGGWPKGASGAPEALAHAELEEETGLRAASMDHVGHLYSAYGHSAQGFDVFLATGLEAGRPRREATEQDMRSGRFSVDQLEDMLRGGRVKDGPSVAAWGLYRLRSGGAQ